MNTLLDKRKFYIDGTWVDPVKVSDLEVIDPSTEEPVAVIRAFSDSLMYSRSCSWDMPLLIMRLTETPCPIISQPHPSKWRTK